MDTRAIKVTRAGMRKRASIVSSKTNMEATEREDLTKGITNSAVRCQKLKNRNSSKISKPGH